MNNTNTEPEQTATTVKLTKKGVPDKRSITSRENINKAQSKVKEIVSKAKAKKTYDAVVLDEGESEDESDSDTEYAIRKVKQQVSEPIPIPQQQSIPTVKDSSEDNEILSRLESLTKSFEQLKSENHTLRNSFHQSNHLNKINSMTRQMMMKF